MASRQINRFVEHLRQAVLARDGATLTDAQLLECFIARRDESAFEILVRRHGPMVLGVCRRVLGNHHDAEDAFQATFLVLVRKAASIKPRELVGNWLYGVAYQTALKARSLASRRGAREKQVTAMPDAEAMPQDLMREVQAILDHELSRLDAHFRVPIVLCDLEGRTRKEAADLLGVPEGTLSSRLARGRTMLAKRLTRHGVTLSAGALAALLTEQSANAGVTTTLVVSTVEAAGAFALGGAVSAKVAILTEGVLKAMLMTKLKSLALVVLMLGVIGFGGGLFAYHSAAAPEGQVDNRRGDNLHPAANLLGPEAEAGKKADAPVVREIDLKGYRTEPPKNVFGKPVEIGSAQDLAKAFPDAAWQKKIAGQVDFTKERLLFFVWLGSRSDKFTVRAGKKNDVLVHHQPGENDDEYAHFRLFAIAKDQSWRIVTGEHEPSEDVVVWGVEVDGVQCRLRADQLVWQVGEAPTFKLDVRYRGTRKDFTVTLDQLAHQALVDELVCEWRGGGDAPAKELLPGKQFDDIPFKLSNHWSPGAYFGSPPPARRADALETTDGLKFVPGRHRVRVAVFAIDHEKTWVRALSNAVEIEVVEAGKKPLPMVGQTSGKVVEKGLALSVHLRKKVFEPNDPIDLGFTLRNESKKMLYVGDGYLGPDYQETGPGRHFEIHAAPTGKDTLLFWSGMMTEGHTSGIRKVFKLEPGETYEGVIRLSAGAANDKDFARKRHEDRGGQFATKADKKHVLGGDARQYSVRLVYQVNTETHGVHLPPKEFKDDMLWNGKITSEPLSFEIQPPARKDGERIQGRWQSLKFEIDGEALDHVRSFLDCADDTFRLRYGKASWEGSFKLDTAAQMNRIDLSVTKVGDGALNTIDTWRGKHWEGIYRFEGDTLRVCFGKERPKAFPLRSGIEQELHVFKRIDAGTTDAADPPRKPAAKAVKLVLSKVTAERTEKHVVFRCQAALENATGKDWSIDIVYPPFSEMTLEVIDTQGRKLLARQQYVSVAPMPRDFVLKQGESKSANLALYSDPFPDNVESVNVRLTGVLPGASQFFRELFSSETVEIKVAPAKK